MNTKQIIGKIKIGNSLTKSKNYFKYNIREDQQNKI